MVSTRRSEKKTAYKAGSTVEILTSDGISVGTLVKKIALGSILDQSPNKESCSHHNRKKKDKDAVDHWIVKLQGEEDYSPFSEHAFGKILEEFPAPSSIETSESETSSATPEQQESIMSHNSTCSAKVTSSAPSHNELPADPTSKRRDVNSDDSPLNSSPPSEKVNPATKRARSPPNQPKSVTSSTTAETEPCTELSDPNTTVTTTQAPGDSKTRAVGSNNSGQVVVTELHPNKKRRVAVPTSKPLPKVMPPPPPQPCTRVNTRSSGQVLYTATDHVDTLLKQGRGRQKKDTNVGKRNENGELVIKVPMKTGILYLYHGKRRRAKFVSLK